MIPVGDLRRVHRAARCPTTGAKLQDLWLINSGYKNNLRPSREKSHHQHKREGSMCLQKLIYESVSYDAESGL